MKPVAPPTTDSTGIRDPKAWPDLKVIVEPSLAWIPATRPYIARTSELRTFWAFKRNNLMLMFDVFEGTDPFTAITTPVIARLPMFFPLPPEGKRLSASSKLARLFDVLVGRRDRRLDRLPLNRLKGKLARIEVGDVRVSSHHDASDIKRKRAYPLHESQKYSVVRRVMERLA